MEEMTDVARAVSRAFDAHRIFIAKNVSSKVKEHLSERGERNMPVYFIPHEGGRQHKQLLYLNIHSLATYAQKLDGVFVMPPTPRHVEIPHIGAESYLVSLLDVDCGPLSRPDIRYMH